MGAFLCGCYALLNLRSKWYSRSPFRTPQEFLCGRSWNYYVRIRLTVAIASALNSIATFGLVQTAQFVCRVGLICANCINICSPDFQTTLDVHPTSCPLLNCYRDVPAAHGQPSVPANRSRIHRFRVLFEVMRQQNSYSIRHLPVPKPLWGHCCTNYSLLPEFSWRCDRVKVHGLSHVYISLT